MPEQRTTGLCGLYAITPDGLPAAQLLAQVEAALRGGVAIVQYRDKSSAPAQRVDTARALRALCRQYPARLIVNDDLLLTLAVDADGLHLGGDDGDLAAARQSLGPGKLLGASCYADLGRARAAVAAGVDYVAFGAVYPSPTKPLAACAPLELFRQARAELPVPLCAIGGISVDNAPPLLAAGANMLAVISDLFAAPDIAARAAAYQPLFEKTQ